MTLTERLGTIRDFALRAIGALPGDDQGGSLPARIIRVGHLLFRGYADDDLTIHASSLTFVTLTSLVPILAVGFALVKGFGFGADQLATVEQMEWFLQMPAQWQEFVQKILDIVNTTNFAALGWIGLAFFVLTAVLLLANVEKSFNRVWGVAKDRSLLRQVANYTSVLVLVPVLMGLAGALKAQVAISRKILDVDVNAWAQNLAAFAILWLAIGFLYAFVPNTRVKPRAAALSSLLTTLVFLGWMRVFTVMQVGVVNYGRIYGAFAAVPVFMFWMYVTWVILLLGAEFAFALQLAAAGVPTTYPRAIYMLGHHSTLPAEYLDQRRYASHRELRMPDGQPILQPQRNYIAIWGYWNGLDEVLATEDLRRRYCRGVNAVQALAQERITPPEYEGLMEKTRRLLASAGFESTNLRGTHFLLTITPEDELARDPDGTAAVRLCNFECLKKLG